MKHQILNLIHRAVLDLAGGPLYSPDNAQIHSAAAEIALHSLMNPCLGGIGNQFRNSVPVMSIPATPVTALFGLFFCKGFLQATELSLGS